MWENKVWEEAEKEAACREAGLRALRVRLQAEASRQQEWIGRGDRLERLGCGRGSGPQEEDVGKPGCPNGRHQAEGMKSRLQPQKSGCGYEGK